MAYAAVKITIGQALGGGGYNSVIKGSAAPDFATVTANVATLVSDGASPTQAHVNTLNTNFTALATALSGDVAIVWDGSVITNKRQLRAAMDLISKAIDGGHGGLAA